MPSKQIMASNIDPSKIGLYEILGLSFGATNQEILRAYKAKAREFHPDKSGTDETEEYMKRLNKAKDTLLSEKRVEYDETLGENEDGTFDAAGFLSEGIGTISYSRDCKFIIVIYEINPLPCTCTMHAEWTMHCHYRAYLQCALGYRCISKRMLSVGQFMCTL